MNSRSRPKVSIRTIQISTCSSAETFALYTGKCVLHVNANVNVNFDAMHYLLATDMRCKVLTLLGTYRFRDSEVLEPDFTQKVQSVVEVMRPFVHCLNDLMTVGYSEEEEEEEE
jgi:hypothetical protein